MELNEVIGNAAQEGNKMGREKEAADFIGLRNCLLGGGR
jgi:hypothetical protein